MPASRDFEWLTGDLVYILRDLLYGTGVEAKCNIE